MSPTKRTWLLASQIDLDKGLTLKKNIRVSPEVRLNRTGSSFEVTVFFEEKGNKGAGMNLGFPELLVAYELMKFPKRRMTIYFPEMMTWENRNEYVEEKILSVLLPYFNLDISFYGNGQSKDTLIINLRIKGTDYIGSTEKKLGDFDRFLDYEIPM